ncbi:uncharacterized protein LOC127750116 [Frankliniella occidentalis]|uniref:Uncharacterized protein LOC127750116 n=1 Tax=Frankliniella occidentalis TaxID=133901 RepID=A0A9C6UCP2_FRAOC|nr:uncharacterized protein LOC127750116 [Frankliniella occidentalis]
MELTQLPVDVLVMAMQFLDVPSLFACRLVCKRLADLALRADVWRHQGFRGGRDADGTPCACAVLRLAPCLRVLGLRLPIRGCRRAYASTSCAAEVLTLQVAEGRTALQAAQQLIRSQEALGRLRGIRLVFDGVLAPTEASALLETVALTTGLTTLDMLPSYECEPPPVAVPSSTSSSSIKRFRCELRRGTLDFANFVLAAHSATLEKVEFYTVSFLKRLTSNLLGGMPNLRELKCPALPGLEAVAACESLRVLELRVPPDQRSAASAAKLLQASVQLTELRLNYMFHFGGADGVGADLVLALASSGRSRVQALTIENFVVCSEDEYPYLQPLIRALPSLPALQRLKVDGKPHRLLRAIRPATAPALRSVDVGALAYGCAHEWVHGVTVRTVMSANPSLHMKFAASEAVCRDIYACSVCNACARGCHRELLECVASEHGADGYNLGLFSHEPTADCSHRHFTDDNCRWVHVPQSR